MHQINPLDTLPQRLVGVWAHPDDEAYLSAGLMARMTDAGRSVTVVTATRGEKGTDDPSRHGTAAFATHREQELRASLAELGVGDVRILGLPDGGCDLIDDGEMIAAIGAVFAEVQPDAVITFGPDGITGHPDHRAVSRWTTEAWRHHDGADLRYATMTHEYVAHYAELHDQLGAFDQFGLDGPVSVGDDQVVAAYDLSEAELDRKRRALAHHASQTEPLAAVMGEDTYRTWWRTEWFRRPTAAETTSCVMPMRITTPELAVAA